MRLLIQRVSRASVTIEDRIVGEIGQGFCVFVGISD
ncbi:MAG: D-aminoacyl-tRNA deacylase, partial [Lachnospiraceae bacterium]|nr:D-aminoacyl-tRNA deacylase [Lachnospiraceae bacterium]